MLITLFVILCDVAIIGCCRRLGENIVYPDDDTWDFTGGFWTGMITMAILIVINFIVFEVTG